jgi:energy-coupling factor transporter ATP-binding protein EcfA2
MRDVHHWPCKAALDRDLIVIDESFFEFSTMDRRYSSLHYALERENVIVLRSLGKSLGRALSWVRDNIKKTHGIFLITGPTGSGKSTTLYAVLSILNTTSVNIVTLEDPVEYFIEGVNQSQINPDIGLTFASLVAAQAGAIVTHVDSSKQSLSWAKENAELSRVPEGFLRYIPDDAAKFSRREVRRGKD